LTFLGQHEHNLDSKDRLTIPSRFRDALADGVVLFQDLDPCVSIYPKAGYEKLTERYLGTLNPLSSKSRLMLRRFHGRARDVSLDSAGRVLLPKNLLEHAGIESSCIVVGVDDHLEVWSPEGWAAQEELMEAEAAGLAEELATGGNEG